MEPAWIEAIGVVITALFTAVLAAATIKLWNSTNRLAEGGEASSEQQLRAYIGVTNSSARVDVRDFRATLTVRNAGQTPAYNVHGFGMARFGNTFDPKWEGEMRSFAANAYMLPNSDFHFRIVEPVATLMQGVSNDGVMRTLFAFGRLEYQDAFGRDRWLTFRFTVGGDLAAGTAQFAPCEQGNEAN